MSPAILILLVLFAVLYAALCLRMLANSASPAGATGAIGVARNLARAEEVNRLNSKGPA